jgi:predicted Zn-dependent peptidase
MTRWLRCAALAPLVAVLAACPGAGSTTVATLPSDGAIPGDRPRGKPAAGADAWVGRDLIAAPAAVAPRPLVMPAIRRFTLPNGLAVIAVAAEVPVVTFQLGIRAGRRHETRDKTGLASVTAAALIRGSAKRSRAQLDAAAEAAGAALSASASYEVTLLGCSVPQVDASTCATILGEVLASPGIDGKRIEEARAEVARSLRQSRADQGQLAGLHLQNALWGDDHVRGWVASEASLARIGQRDVADWVRGRIRPDNATLLVVGDLAPAALEAQLRRALGGWKKGAAAPALGRVADPTPRGLTIRVIDQPGAVRGQVRIGQLGVGHTDDDFLVLALLNHALGGSSSSRFARAVRDKLGPASSASASLDRNLERGAQVASGSAPTAQLVALMRLMIDEIERLRGRGLTDAEVDRASSEMASAHAVRFDSPVALGEALLAAALHGRDEGAVRDFAIDVATIDAARARAVAARRLDGKDLAIVLIGDGAMIGRALDDAGLTYERIPVSAPIAAHERAQAAVPAVAATPAAEAAARAVLDAALKRKGGAERLGKLRSIRWKATASLTMQGNKLSGVIEKRTVLPDKLRLDMTLDGGKVEVTTVLDGKRGWARQSQAGGAARVIDFPDAEVAAGRGQLWRDPELVLLRHREPGAKLAPEADVELDGVACHAIRVTDQTGTRSALLFVDKKAGRMIGMRYSEQGQTAEERYAGWKKVGGVEVAHRRTTRSADVDITTTLGEVAFDGAIDAAVFARPATK